MIKKKKQNFPLHVRVKPNRQTEFVTGANNTE